MPARAAGTYQVTNPNDSGPGSLRDAITSANSDPDSTISITSQVTAPIVLTSGYLSIQASMTISNDSGAPITIDGNNSSQIFYIGSQNPCSVTISGGPSGLTLTHAVSWDGAIYVGSSASLSLTGCTVSHNSGGPFLMPLGGGIFNVGTATLTNCTISDNSVFGGGGIDNEGSLSMENCVVTRNSATGGDGGGLVTSGTTVLNNCTITDNSTVGLGGGLFASGTLTATNCTVSGNSAGAGAGVSNFAAATFTNCTLAGNSATNGGGAIYSYAQAALVNCTAAGNSGPQLTADGADGANNLALLNTIVSGGTAFSTSQGGVITSLGHNLSSDSGEGFLTAAGDQVNTDPHLLPPGDYGGPTQTMKLPSTSPAVDAGDDAVLSAPYSLSTDQRGIARPQGSHLDIGAFELEAGPDLAVSLSAPSSITENGSLTYSFTVTNNGPGTATGVTLVDTLPPGVTYASATCSQGTPSQAGGVVTVPIGTVAAGASVTGAIVVAAPEEGSLANTALVYHDLEDPVAANNTATVTTTVTDPSVNLTGGLSITGSRGQPLTNVQVATFTDPAGGEAAADYSASIDWGDGTPVSAGTINLTGGAFSVAGSHTYASGGIYPITVTVHHDAAPDAATYDTAVISPVTYRVINSSDSGPGSLRAAVNAANTTPGSIISITPQVTAPIVLTTGELAITTSVTISNDSGAAVTVDGNASSRIFHVAAGAVTIAGGTNGLTITNGFAPDGYGGGVRVESGASLTAADITVSNCTLPEQPISEKGGGLCSAGVVSLTRCTITGCVLPNNLTDHVAVVEEGGGFYNAGTATLTNCTLSGNFAEAPGGGAIYNDGGTATLLACTLANNAAWGTGGAGVLNGSGAITLTGCTLSGNDALGGWGGGGVFNAGTAAIANCTFSANIAWHGGAVANATAGGSAAPNSANLTLTNCTVAGNTGPQVVSDAYNGPAPITLLNTILGGNTTLSVIAGGTILSRGHNLASDGARGFLTAPGDRVNTDPQLLPLGNYGGPTQTMRPAGASPAIDAGDDAVLSAPYNLTTDQRGAARPQGLHVDTGAVELQSGADISLSLSAPPSVVAGSSLTYSFTVTNNGLGGSAGVTFVDTLPPGVTYMSAASSQGTPSQAGGVVTVPVGALAPGASVTGTIVTTAAGVGPISSTALVYHSSPGPGSPDATAAVTTTVTAPAGAGAPPTLLVTNSNDAGPGSLRAAINTANALSGARISVTPAVTAPIVLTGGELLIENSMSISNDSGTALTIDGNNNSRVFEVDSAAVNISGGAHGITITHGAAPQGAGLLIWGRSHLALTNCAIAANNAPSSDSGGGGIYNSGAVVLSNCSIANNSTQGSGGGIWSIGTVSLNNSAISGNTAASGAGALDNRGSAAFADSVIANNSDAGAAGAVSSSGPLSLTNCTLSGNSGGWLGGVYEEVTTAAFTDCTFAGNSGTSEGALYTDSGASVVLVNCTVSGNSGPQVFCSGKNGVAAVTLLNTILGGSAALSATGGGVITSLGHNLSSDAGGGFLTAPGDPVNTDPQLLPLGNYGGPTQTMKLIPSSPAIDAGDDAVLSAPYNLATDQRGVARPQGAHVDVGAVELRPIPAVPTGVKAVGGVGSARITVTWTASPGAASYNVKRGLRSGGPYTTLAPGATTNSFVDNTIIYGATYYYVVSAVAPDRESGNSAETSAIAISSLLAPAGLQATPGIGKIALSWRAVVGATGYNVRRSTAGSGPYAILAPNIAASNFDDVTAIPGVTYFYTVSTLDNGLESSTTAPVNSALLPVDVTVGSDNRARLLRNSSNGIASLWSVDSSSTPTPGPTYGPYAGYTAHSTAAGADGMTRVLWDKNDSSIAIWLMSANNVLQKYLLVPPPVRVHKL